jgi:hypothetical protein
MATSSESTSFTLVSRPGVRRDGTRLDNPFYNHAVWTRFQRGQPRKMGGYQLMSDLVSGPVRDMYVDARSIGNTAHSFSPSGIEQLAFDNDGIGGGVNVRTPAGFVTNADYTWQSAGMFSNGGGGIPALIAAASPDADNIADDTAGPVYSAAVQGTALFTAVSDGTPITVSGGCCVLQPFLFVYGSNGLIRNSNANDFSAATGWTGSDANSANVAGSKVVKGLSTRAGGQSPAGLFWALDALIRVSFVGGSVLWKYDTVSSAISVLAKNAIVEYDGVYYWPGVDRFFMYNGVVQELPNDMNLNFFYDSINPLARNKCWAMKVPRFGEIWWFFPMGSALECNHAIIYNVREKTWYDTPLERTAGAPPQIFTLPVMAGGDQRATIALTLTGRVGDFAVGQLLTGGTSGATGTLRRVLTNFLNVETLSGVFVAGEIVTSISATATVSTAPVTQTLNSIWLHEKGVNRIYKQDSTALAAEFETTSFQWMSGGPPGPTAPAGPVVQTRIARLEPDFVMAEGMTVRVNGRAYAQAADVLSAVHVIEPDTKFVDLREQRREMSLVFRADVIDSDFQAGRLQVTVEPGDVRG